MSDPNLYVTAFKKDPGSLASGNALRGFQEVSLGIVSTPSMNGPASSLISTSQNTRASQGMTLTFAGYSFAMTDAGANGSQGSLLLFTLPAKVNLIKPAYANLAIQAALGSSSGIVTGAAVVGSLGSAAAGVNNATLTSTEADYVASTASTLTAYAGAFKGIGVTTFAQDGTAGAKGVYLNFAVPDADSAGSDALLLTGTIDFTWQQLN